MLILMSKPASERGGTSDRAFMAFKLHQFFCGAGRLYSTLREPHRRRVTLDGQLFDPEAKETRLYPTFFCRNCGQEHHPIVLSDQDGRRQALPRPIDEPPLDNEDRAEQAGYLMPEPLADTEFTFDGTPEQYPEDWIMPNPPEIQYVGSKAFYSSITDRITLPPRELFVSAEEFYATALHETVHSTGSQGRLARESILEAAPFGSETYSAEELVAEMGAAYLCAEAGISTTVIHNQAAYVAGWLKKLHDDRKLLIQAAAQAQCAADFILNRQHTA